MPLQALTTYGADFDGDCLNILYIPNRAFWEEASKCFNPRNAMLISNNDGRFNSAMSIFKDILININGMIQLSRKHYSQSDLSKIEAVKAKWGN